MRCCKVLVLLMALACIAADEKADNKPTFRIPSDFQAISMIQLESHEDTPTPPFSVCKYLLETASSRVAKGDSWPDVAKHIAGVRDTLPENVRAACDAFVKRNRDDIISLLQFDLDPEMQNLLHVAAAQAAQTAAAASAVGNAPPTTTASTDSSASAGAGGPDQAELFRQFWEEKGKYCGACLTLTKKIQKWISMNCTQTVIVDRVMRMCDTMAGTVRQQCAGNRDLVASVLSDLVSKLPLPNHCAYIGLCEKTMVIRALANPVVMSDKQNALIQDLEGVSPNLEQEGETVLQIAHSTADTAPEITFDLSGGGDVSYRDVDKSTGARFPKVYIDGTHDALSMLELSNSSIFDVTNANDPQVQLNAQNPSSIDVEAMHESLSANTAPLNTGLFGGPAVNPLDEAVALKRCAACQFTIGSLFEFMSNPRTIRTILPTVKGACNNCNSPEEVAKCQDFVEIHGVEFYQDVIRQGLPSKWCPRLGLCEIHYFIPSPYVLPDSYSAIQANVMSVGDF